MTPFLNYHHLRYFRAVASDGNLTRAAARLRISQSALSMQIRQLERTLGHDLFVRANRRLVLTDTGRLVLDYADTIFRTGDELLTVLDRDAPGHRKQLHVGAVSTMSRNFQMDLLRRHGAGELAGLLGPGLLPVDRITRPWRARAHVEAALPQLRAEQRALLEAYSAGVNLGLSALSVRPPEYLLLRERPQPWRPED